MKKTILKKTILSLLVFSFLSLSSKAEVQYEEVLKAEEFPVGNMLEWATSYEDNTNLFFIERSLDGANFQNVGQIEAAGFAEDGKKYHFLDVGVQQEKAYYRLKQTDKDGTASFSHIVAMQKTIKNDFMVVRMNGTDIATDFECSIDNLIAGTMTYEVLNLKGEVLASDQAVLTVGLNDLSISMEEFNEGIYKLKLSLNDEIETLVIQRVMKEKKPVLRASKGNEEAKGG